MKTRLAGVLAYLGFAPLLPLVKFRDKEEPVLLHHIQHSLDLNFLLLPALIFLVIVQTVEMEFGLNLPNMDLRTLAVIVLLMDILSCTPLVLWAFLWITSIIQAARHKVTTEGLVDRLTPRKLPRKLSVAWSMMLALGIVLILFVILRANQLAGQTREPASVYLLYETLDPIPRWVYASGFYPIAELANARWGEGSVAVEQLTQENIDHALRNGRLVVLASHGGYSMGTIGLSFNPDDYYAPADVDRIGGAGPNLQVVYISGCNTGTLASEWERSLRPAQAITFDRISWASEHALWLWTGGVKAVLEIR